MTFHALLSGLDDPLNILPSSCLEGISHLKSPLPVLSLWWPVSALVTRPRPSPIFQKEYGRDIHDHWLCWTALGQPMGSQCSYSTSVSALTQPPVQEIAVHREVAQFDSSTSPTNHRFKTLQYLMQGRTSDSAETPTYLLSCKASTEGKGVFF